MVLLLTTMMLLLLILMMVAGLLPKDPRSRPIGDRLQYMVWLGQLVWLDHLARSISDPSTPQSEIFI